ncbi:hypothetical protein [Spirosoma radiotolerans]|uniref:hypothetical protein n=1 Tax=Spirosoma radiotolerans TaxID=1379870 RepID=UPI000AA97A7D|nr:hypothetical protein [Spirosoma radiotolerans]
MTHLDCEIGNAFCCELRIGIGTGSNLKNLSVRFNETVSFQRYISQNGFDLVESFVWIHDVNENFVNIYNTIY